MKPPSSRHTAGSLDLNSLPDPRHLKKKSPAEHRSKAYRGTQLPTGTIKPADLKGHEKGQWKQEATSMRKPMLPSKNEQRIPSVLEPQDENTEDLPHREQKTFIKLQRQ